MKLISFQDIIQRAQKFYEYWAEFAMYDLGEEIAKYIEKKYGQFDIPSRKKFSKAAGISNDTLTRILRSDDSVSIRSICKVMHAMGKHIEIKIESNVLS